MTSSRSTTAARRTLTRDKERNLGPSSCLTRVKLPDPARPAPTRRQGQTDQQHESSVPSLDPVLPTTPPRLDAVPIKSTTLGTGGQRRRREQEGESFVDKVRQQQSGSESDKGLGASNGNDGDDNRSGYERITSRFTVQETSLWR